MSFGVFTIEIIAIKCSIIHTSIGDDDDDSTILNILLYIYVVDGVELWISSKCKVIVNGTCCTLYNLHIHYIPITEVDFIYDEESNTEN